MKALLLIDIQNDYFPGGRFPLKGMRRATRNAASLLEDFRKKGLPILHVMHLRASQGEAIDRSPGVFFVEGTKGAEIFPGVSPRKNETVITKRYPNAFRETGLDDILRVLDVQDLHVAGAMTNMCIDSTVRAAFDLGYTVTIHEKACAARGFLGTNLVHLVSIKTLASVFAKTE
jgi:nicotinamidase-related amidase